MCPVSTVCFSGAVWARGQTSRRGQRSWSRSLPLITYTHTFFIWVAFRLLKKMLYDKMIWKLSSRSDLTSLLRWRCHVHLKHTSWLVILCVAVNTSLCLKEIFEILSTLSSACSTVYWTFSSFMILRKNYCSLRPSCLQFIWCDVTFLVCVSPESIMNDLSATAPGMVKQAIQVIKVTHTLKTHRARVKFYLQISTLWMIFIFFLL